jgi:hypothetical protein
LKTLLIRILKLLSSMRTGIALFCILLAASLAGSLLPFSVSHRWIYGSVWFNAILFLIGLSTLSCLIARFPVRKGKIPGFLLHLGIPLLVAGFIQYNLFSTTGTVPFSAGESSRTAVKASHGEMNLPFTLKLEKFITETNPVSISQFLEIRHARRVTRHAFAGPTNIFFAGGEVSILNILRDFRILDGRQITDVSTNWNNPGIRIRTSTNVGWLFALYPQYSTMKNSGGTSFSYKFRRTGGSIARFASTVRVTPDGKDPFTAVIEVNKPLRIGGYTVYQYSYDVNKPDWTELMVRKESGNLLILAGFLLICVGLFSLLFVKTILAKDQQ